MEPGPQQSSVKLQHDGTRAAFVCGSTCLEVSDLHTSFSRLLQDVCESSDGNFELEVPLSLAEAQAWLEYIDHSQGDTATDRLCDATLLRALRAASFLQDSESEELLANEIATALEPQRVPSSHGEARCEDPTPEQRARAETILALAPPALLHTILTNVEPRPTEINEGVVPGDFITFQLMTDTAAHIMLITPPDLHPAVLRTRFPSIHLHRTLTILPMPWCGTNTTLIPARWPCILQLMLAALVALSPRLHPDLAAAESCETPASTKRDADRPLKRPRSPEHAPHLPQTAAAGAADGGACCSTSLCAAVSSRRTGTSADLDLTRLNLGLIHHSHCCWAPAIAEFRQLQDLHLLINDLASADVPQLLAAARSVPLLRGLHLYSKWSMAIECEEVIDLLNGLHDLPKLTAVTLDNCFKAEADVCVWAVSIKVLAHMLAFSTLTNLTALTLKRNRMPVLLARCLSKAIRQLPRLENLEVTNCGEGDFCAVRSFGLSDNQLRSLSLGGNHVPDGGQYFSLRHFVNDRYSGLTALRMVLECGADVHRDPEQLARALVRMQELRSLDLPLAGLQDAGVQSLAGALPTLTCLTRLDIGGNFATHEGVFAVLRTTRERRGDDGAAGLRWLGVCGNTVAEAHVAELAALLRAQPELEELEVGDMHMAATASTQLLRAMQAHPGLHRAMLMADAVGSDDFKGVSGALAALTGLTRLDLQLHRNEDGQFRALLQAAEETAPWVRIVDWEWEEAVLDGNPINPFGYRLQYVR